MDEATRSRFEEITKTLTARYEVALKGVPNEDKRMTLTDMAYDLYRVGYSLYEKIHPSSWRENTVINPLTGDLSYGSDAEQIRILDRTLRVFRLATEAFQAVVKDHPEVNGPWTLGIRLCCCGRCTIATREWQPI